MAKQDLMNAVAPDKDTILTYIKTFGGCDAPIGIDAVLEPWAKQKHMLWYLLGRQLTREYDITISKSFDVLIGSLSNLYSFNRDSGTVKHGKPGVQKNQFIQEYISVVSSIYDESGETHSTLLYRLLNAFTFTRETISLPNKKQIVEYQGQKITLQEGMKPMRAIGKVVSLLGASKFPHFEEFRIQHSNIFTGKTIEGTLVLSIHPLDYLTISDNANGWSSCMSWTLPDLGCYKKGTLEILNSNNVLIAYLKSDSDFEFTPGYTWNNKSWRSLVVVNKNLIVAGKAYPYEHADLSQKVVEILRQLAKDNLHWKYKYGVQEYKDLDSVWNKHMLEDRKWDKTKQNRNILIDSKFMYNDMMKDENDTSFWCVRNKTNKQKVLSMAGKTYCLDCGKETPYHGSEGEEILICNDCFDTHTCTGCSKYIHETDPVLLHKGEAYCLECYSNFKICPNCLETVKYGREYVVPHTQKVLDTFQKQGEDRIPFLSYWFSAKELTMDFDCSVVEVCDGCVNTMKQKQEIKYINKTWLAYLTEVYPADSEYVLSRKKSAWSRLYDSVDS